MNEIDPIARLYKDITSILQTMTIKYSSKAEAYETMDIRMLADRYINALQHKDTFQMYDDYTVEEFIECGIVDPIKIRDYMRRLDTVPSILQKKLLSLRREREINTYEEPNEYYRILNGLPPLSDTEFFYVTPEICEQYNIPMNLPVHKIRKEMGMFYVNLLDGLGFFDELYKAHPDKPYLHYLGKWQIPIQTARTAANFAILGVTQDDIMESTYREFIRSYEKARLYFISTQYTYEFRKMIPNYDNFIALCIFVMAIQQVSVRAIENAVQREFYDEYMVQLLYETYGFPYYAKIDTNTQKQIVQNLNLLIQNKATDKVLLDITSILGFTDATIYQYYLMKKPRFDEKGRPIIAKKRQVNKTTGVSEEVYDPEAMFSLYFQKVPIDTENVKTALMESLNKVEYSDLTYYDPFWWEDDKLHSEIWDTQYNYMETKYLGVTTPYRLTDVLFQSIILLRVIMDKSNDLGDITLQLPMITDKHVSLPDVVILYLALMAKKMDLSGQILSSPSKIIHFLEVNDQEIKKDADRIEILGFNFDAFSPGRIQETKSILEKYLKRKKYRVVNGHDVDLREDGSQDKSGPTHKIRFTYDETDLNEFYQYVAELAVPNINPADKIKALNKIYENIHLLYDFLSYQMSITTDYDEYYALKTMYDTAFYTNEVHHMFEIETENGPRVATTFLEYFKYTNTELYEFVKNVDREDAYAYIDHIIFKMEELSFDVGYLYLLNDGISPLMELLVILIKFFKSYTMDFVELSSLMVMDWDLENIIRLFDSVEHVKKLNQVEDTMDFSVADLVHKIAVHYRLPDECIQMVDYVVSHGEIRIEDEQLFKAMEEFFKLRKIDQVDSYFHFGDMLNATKATIKLEDGLHFTDAVVKVER